MTTVGTYYLGAVISGDYTLTWVSTPGDWYVRTPGERVAPHWSRTQNLLTKTKKLRMKIIVFGPPGHVWKLSPMRDNLEDLKLTVVATSIPISSKLLACTCKLAMPQHVLDWYGQT
eukprot:275370-Pyramimonas_sp.AAC.1